MKPHLRAMWNWGSEHTFTVLIVGGLVGAILGAVGYNNLSDRQSETEGDLRVIQRTVESSCAYARGLEERPPTDAEIRKCARLLIENAKAKPIRAICIEQDRVGNEPPRCLERRGVVRQQGSTPSQPSGPGEGPDTVDRPVAPDRPDAPSSPPATTPPSPAPTEPVPEPPAPEPTNPVPTTNRPVQVTAPGVSVGAGADGVCAGVGGIAVGVGRC